MTFWMCIVGTWLGRPTKTDEPPLYMERIPLTIGEWVGEEKGALSSETDYLPEDVDIWRRQYLRSTSDTALELSVLMTGQNTKAALHQPEICIVLP